METVSYLTINDETKEIADLVSRNTIEDIGAVVATQNNNIKQIQLAIGNGGSFSTAMEDVQVAAQTAKTDATLAENLARTADNKATAASELASAAQISAANASQMADSAWDKAAEVENLITAIDRKIDTAVNSANATWLEVNDTTEIVNAALNRVKQIETLANTANETANSANVAAATAQEIAAQANSSTDNIITELSTLNSIVNSSDWFMNHSSLTNDLVVDSSKNYYTYDSTTHVISKVKPIGTENPQDQEWYEIDKDIQNYIASHLAETNEGFYVLATAVGWKILISTGSNNYVPGVFIVSPNGVIKQGLTNDGITFDNTVPLIIGDANAYITFDGDGNISIGGAGVNIKTTTTIGENNKTFAQVLDDLSSAIVSIEYGKGESNIDHLDIQSWSTETPEWESDKYIWMRTFNGSTYTYTCIQGAAGPRGEEGPRGMTGPEGPRGIGIESVATSYAISDSEFITPSEDEWVNSTWDLNSTDGTIGTTGSGFDISTSIKKGSWLWTRTVTTYTDETTNTAYQKTYVGTDGTSIPSSTVTIIPREINWNEGTAILEAQLIVEGEKITPTNYYWTKGPDNTPVSTNSTLTITDFDLTYNCTVKW